MMDAQRHQTPTLALPIGCRRGFLALSHTRIATEYTDSVHETKTTCFRIGGQQLNQPQPYHYPSPSAARIHHPVLSDQRIAAQN
jgi:hypothetical protein